MQIAESQTGISRAMARFSQRVVPEGQVPSTGKALTGSKSPLLASISAVIRCTKSGASAGTIGADGDGKETPGNFDFVQGGQGLVHRREILVHDGLAFAGVGLLDGLS
jgi:polygalacturonase